jgi:aminopeptidase-like protein
VNPYGLSREFREFTRMIQKIRANSRYSRLMVWTRLPNKGRVGFFASIGSTRFAVGVQIKFWLNHVSSTMYLHYQLVESLLFSEV